MQNQPLILVFQVAEAIPATHFDQQKKRRKRHFSLVLGRQSGR